MWWVTICKGDYRMPVKFTSFNDAADFMQSLFTSDEYKDIKVVLTIAEVR